MEKTKAIKFLVSLIICQFAGIIGSVFTVSSVSSWYPTLTKPWFTPPSWVFAPVWTTLFILMGLSLYLIWSRSSKDKRVKNALIVFGSLLSLNVLWSVAFFGLRSPLMGLFVIALLWAAIAVSLFRFYKISRKAAYLMIPYIIWVSVAALLNLYIWILNL
jgi:translocator protein